jgi:hypothetical protein
VYLTRGTKNSWFIVYSEDDVGDTNYYFNYENEAFDSSKSPPSAELFPNMEHRLQAIKSHLEDPATPQMIQFTHPKVSVGFSSWKHPSSVCKRKTIFVARNRSDSIVTIALLINKIVSTSWSNVRMRMSRRTCVLVR